MQFVHWQWAFVTVWVVLAHREIATVSLHHKGFVKGILFQIKCENCVKSRRGNEEVMLMDTNFMAMFEVMIAVRSNELKVWGVFK